MTVRVSLRPVFAPNMPLLGAIGYEAELELPDGAERSTSTGSLLSIPEAAKMLGKERTTGYSMVRKGLIPTVEVNGRMKVRRDDVEAILKRGTARRRRSA